MSYVNEILESVKAKNPNEPEFLQAVTEVLTTLEPCIEANPQYQKAAEGLRADLMPRCAGKPALLRPAPVAVHDDGNVARHARRVQSGLRLFPPCV